MDVTIAEDVMIAEDVAAVVAVVVVAVAADVVAAAGPRAEHRHKSGSLQYLPTLHRCRQLTRA